jgi:hypothetical protein
LRRCGFLKADDGRKHTKDEQENPHGKLQNKWFSNSDSDPDILFPAFAMRRAAFAANIAKLRGLLARND